VNEVNASDEWRLARVDRPEENVREPFSDL
jgi:hypothetical protein